ncbi:phosphotransferase [Risungbinella massiliensis]|uniref:phosphotransferase n=1 Tax=Risungbinella massiliensis TaxID=1329796 RepID=UPI0005CC3533|nr:phosphotransferase [Risungbinella massiliensis]
MREGTPPEYHNELWSAIEAFGWKPKKVDLYSGVYRVEVDDRIYALKASNRSREKLLLFHKMSSDLQDLGYPHLLTWEKSVSGEQIVQTGKLVWYATDWIQPFDPASIESAIPLVQSLATLHRLAEPIAAKFPILHQQEKEQYLDHLRERKEKWESFVQQASSPEYPSSVDRLIEENCETVDKLFTFALRGMEKFLEKEQGVFPRVTLCHKRIHPSNVVVQDEDQFYWIDWDHVQLDTPARDLAFFLRRFSNWENPEAIYQAYEEANPLSTKEKRLLAIYLAYPERFLAKVTDYYEAPRVSTEGESWQEIQEEFQVYQSFYPLITELWSAKKTEEQTTTVKQETQAKAKSVVRKGNSRVASSRNGRRRTRKG